MTSSNRNNFDLTVALKSLTGVQAREVYAATISITDDAEERGDDPRAVMEQLLLASVIYAMENDLSIRAVKSVIDAYRGALHCLAVTCTGDDIAEA